jgi:hypothetical protein
MLGGAFTISSDIEVPCDSPVRPGTDSLARRKRLGRRTIFGVDNIARFKMKCRAVKELTPVQSTKRFVGAHLSRTSLLFGTTSTNHRENNSPGNEGANALPT